MERLSKEGNGRKKVKRKGEKATTQSQQKEQKQNYKHHVPKNLIGGLSGICVLNLDSNGKKK